MSTRQILASVGLAGVLSAAVITGAHAASARDHISIVGSSTVYPFATVVVEQFGKTTSFKTPKVESTGSGGGLKLFCSGVGVQHPDITNASRRIKSSEVKNCEKNGVKEIVEIKIGYDGIAIANSKKAPQFKLSRKDIFLALALKIPGPDGKLIANPNKTWKDVNASLPNTKIEVLGPPPTSGTRDAFNELAMGGGAKKIEDLAKLRGMAQGAPEIKDMMAKLGIPMSVYTSYETKKGKAPKGKDIFKQVAYAIREDGVFIEAGENDNLIVQKLEANPKALGVFGFSFLDQNLDKVQGSIVDGVVPSFDTIADNSYPISRPLFFYVKKAHVGVIPGMKEYLAEFTSAKAWGEEGYLSERGLIPMPEAERAQFAKAAKNLTPLSMK
jgi:phosphate transport system substrate-binding protein